MKILNIRDRIAVLVNNLNECNKSIEYYKTLCAGDKKRFNINEVIRKKNRIHIKLNQEKQKLLTK